jgi:branched-chain amino acid aminotransferase
MLREDMGINVIERPIARSELYIADEIFMTGTAAEVTPIVEVDNRKIGDGTVGPITKKLQNIFFNAVRGNMEKYKSLLTPVYAE